MPRLLLVDWDEASAAARAAELRASGHEVLVLTKGANFKSFQTVDAAPPDLIVICLDRLPSHGRAVAASLHERKSTRRVPLVFAGGEAPKVLATRPLFPWATYVAWEKFAAAIPKALKKTPPLPAKHAASTKSTAAKLGVEGAALAVLNAPDALERLIGPWEESRGAAERVLLFVTSETELARDFPRAADRLSNRGGLWICWPKKSSGARTDLDGNAVRAFGLARGFVDYKVCSLDETWSGLLFRGPRA
jgi:CheY-like chemotaxis protein